MSSIHVNEILDETGSSSIPPSIPALEARFATAWCKYNGIGTVSINDSFNISSVTDTGTGKYTLNFAVPLNNGDFVASATAGGGNFTANCVGGDVNALNMRTYVIGSSTEVDADPVYTIVFGGN